MAGQSTEQVGDISGLAYELLPGQLKVIARECGPDVMWAVWREYAGCPLPIPYAVDEQHPLAIALGIGYATALCDAFAPRTLYIAKAHGAQLSVRNALRNLAIIADAKAGVKYRKLARQHNLSTRQIINIINGADVEDDSNYDLFK